MGSSFVTKVHGKALYEHSGGYELQKGMCESFNEHEENQKALLDKQPCAVAFPIGAAQRLSPFKKSILE